MHLRPGRGRPPLAKGAWKILGGLNATRPGPRWPQAPGVFTIRDPSPRSVSPYSGHRSPLWGRTACVLRQDSQGRTDSEQRHRAFS